MTVVYETGFLFGNELVFGGELVTKGLNEVVFGLELTGMGFEECGFFRLQRFDGLHLCGKGCVHDAGGVNFCCGWMSRHLAVGIF